MVLDEAKIREAMVETFSLMCGDYLPEYDDNQVDFLVETFTRNVMAKLNDKPLPPDFPAI